MASGWWADTHTAHGAAINLEQELEQRESLAGICVQLRGGQHFEVRRAALRPGRKVVRPTQLAGGAGSAGGVRKDGPQGVCILHNSVQAVSDCSTDSSPAQQRAFSMRWHCLLRLTGE